MSHIARSCTSLKHLHIPLALGCVQEELTTIATYLPGLTSLRIDIKPGKPPSATDNVTHLNLPCLTSLCIEYDWTKDDLEYAPCLRLDARGCPALRTLRITAVDKPANLLVLSLPDGVDEVCVVGLCVGFVEIRWGWLMRGLYKAIPHHHLQPSSPSSHSSSLPVSPLHLRVGFQCLPVLVSLVHLHLPPAAQILSQPPVVHPMASAHHGMGMVGGLRLRLARKLRVR